MIILEGVTKKYGNNTVLDDVSFKIDGGEFVSIVGASGAGKSTLIHCMIGADDVESGHIFIDHYDVTTLSADQIQGLRRKIGVVFQDYKLLPQKTVYENIAFALEVCGYADSTIKQRVEDVLDLTGLREHKDHFPKQLSGGEKQRTAIARALVHAPQLLFADEPTGNLDPQNSLALAELFQKINAGGTTIVLATHNQELVNLIQKRVIMLDHGKLVSDKKQSGYN